MQACLTPFGFGPSNSERFFHKERDVSVSGIQLLQGLRRTLLTIVNISGGSFVSSLSRVGQLLIQQPFYKAWLFVY